MEVDSVSDESDSKSYSSVSNSSMLIQLSRGCPFSSWGELSDSEGLKLMVDDDTESWLLVSKLDVGKDEFDGPVGDGATKAKDDDEEGVEGLLDDDAPKANVEEEDNVPDDLYAWKEVVDEEAIGYWMMAHPAVSELQRVCCLRMMGFWLEVLLNSSFLTACAFGF